MNSVSLSILLPALAAGLLVAATHVPLGAQVLARGIIFIDIAIAQLAGLGVMVADFAGFEAAGWVVQVSALCAALLGALLLTWTERRWPDVQEAIIGVVFVLAATAQILLLAILERLLDSAHKAGQPGTKRGSVSPKEDHAIKNIEAPLVVVAVFSAQHLPIGIMFPIDVHGYSSGPAGAAPAPAGGLSGNEGQRLTFNSIARQQGNGGREFRKT